jgi:thiol-disulfide isomerase/thioredoxin
MKHILYALFLSPVFLCAQAAPDFTVTDILGQSHTLYSQYLNQGKTVMLKIFYSTCPPCNSHAPSLQALYSEWGSGAHDVQFIAVSNKTWETNQTASVFTNNHSITFPAVSATGGSLNVVNTYINAGYGPFFGTPTYIVISPNGTVQWNVSLNNLDAAIASTGAEKPLSSGTADAQKNASVWIAPNPASDYLNVYLKEKPEGNLMITVYNMIGKLLYEYSPQTPQGTLLHREDVSSWLPGTYLVRVATDDKVLRTVRFVRR